VPGVAAAEPEVTGYAQFVARDGKAISTGSGAPTLGVAFGSVLGEAAITGLVSSVIGLGLGVLAALGLQALLRGFGVTLPPGSLVFEPRTVVVGLAVGVGVTVLSAIGPARGAVRIPPVAALDDRQSAASASLRRRFIWGTALAVAGAALLGLGLAKPAIQLVGIGAAALFIGVATLSPALARPLSSVIGRPLPRLLGLAVIIALIGIVNTLMLSVFERTREIGLLRAVGMRWRQVRVMVRSEAVILAIFGAIVGIIIGTALGLALVASLRQQGITETAVPVSSLLIFLVLSALLGLLAASWPARRAAKLDVLAAIAAE
jgi:predicted lysophospholipase L1 biosynthesis ABC-type transport system permease subunit